MDHSKQAQLEHVTKEFERQNKFLTILREIKSGKEASVYLAKLDQRLLALKVYVDPEYRTFRNTSPYILGKHYYEPSHRKAMMKKNRFSKKLQHENWVKREFFLLEKLFSQGAAIPEPIMYVPNAILMEYIGDVNGPAPTLHSQTLDKSEAVYVWQKIVENIHIFYQFGIVHGDLSAFNVLWWKGSLYIIDFPQAIDIRNNPAVEEFLRRDIENSSKYFQQYLTLDVDAIVKEILK